MNDTSTAAVRVSAWPLMITAAAILTITMGMRQSLGLFISPLNTTTGLGIVTISFAMAVGQFVWGASQPIFGAVADRYGSARVVMAGGIMLAIGTAMTPFVRSQWMLLLAMGVITAAGAGAGSFSILIGGFFGAWLGGIALVNTGSYMWMWYADTALALAAAFVNLPIEEAPLVQVRAAPA